MEAIHDEASGVGLASAMGFVLLVVLDIWSSL
jgi:hypothetical protein